MKKFILLLTIVMLSFLSNAQEVRDLMFNPAFVPLYGKEYVNEPLLVNVPTKDNITFNHYLHWLPTNIYSGYRIKKIEIVLKIVKIDFSLDTVQLKVFAQDISEFNDTIYHKGVWQSVKDAMGYYPLSSVSFKFGTSSPIKYYKQTWKLHLVDNTIIEQDVNEAYIEYILQVPRTFDNISFYDLNGKKLCEKPTISGVYIIESFNARRKLGILVY